jgi:multidrug resistance efflux pump
MTESGNTIKSPLALRVRRLQYQILPIVVVVICGLLTAALWSRQMHGAVGTGEVNAVQVQLESKVPGMLIALPKPVEMFDNVRSGDVVARIDLSIDEAELRRLEQELAGLEGNNAASKPAATAVATTESAPNSTAGWYHSRIEELQTRLRAQEIKAPISGMIVRVHKRPGESATPGKEIMTIAAEQGEFIVGYFRQDQGARPTPGQSVQIRGRGKPIRSYRATVVNVSPQVELFPVRHRRAPLVEEWGFVAQIAVPKSAQFKPGEMLDLVLEPAAAN